MWYKIQIITITKNGGLIEVENTAKKVKDVFNDYEAKGKIQECEIINLSIYNRFKIK